MLDDAVDFRSVDPVILVRQQDAEPSDLPPRDLGTPRLRFLAERLYGLAEDQQVVKESVTPEALIGVVPARRLDLRGKRIAIGTATDPYQPAERAFRLTRALLEVFASRQNLSLSITTKSDLVTRDVELLARVSERNDLQVNLTITSPHYALSRRIEPRAPRPDKRLAAVRTLSEAGVRVGIFLMPVMPRINDAPEDLELLMRLAREAGASG